MVASLPKTVVRPAVDPFTSRTGAVRSIVIVCGVVRPSVAVGSGSTTKTLYVPSVRPASATSNVPPLTVAGNLVEVMHEIGSAQLDGAATTVRDVPLETVPVARGTRSRVIAGTEIVVRLA